MILDRIVVSTRAEVAERKARIPLAEMRARAEAAPVARGLAGALKRERVALIAEIKRASPSRGVLRSDFDLAALARMYAEGGAAAISVLTNGEYFGGSPNDLSAVCDATDVPVMRKDFVVDEYQIYEARAYQADAMLLISQLLSYAQLRDYLVLTRSLGMSAMVEFHDEYGLEHALLARAPIIGINNRDLRDFRVDLATTERLARLIPQDRTIVAESGIFSAADVERVARAGVHACLVGEALMRAPDVASKVRELASVPRRA